MLLSSLNKAWEDPYGCMYSVCLTEALVMSLGFTALQHCKMIWDASVVIWSILKPVIHAATECYGWVHGSYTAMSNVHVCGPCYHPRPCGYPWYLSLSEVMLMYMGHVTGHVEVSNSCGSLGLYQYLRSVLPLRVMCGSLVMMLPVARLMSMACVST